MRDLYPSRYSKEVEITKRKDPVIHAGIDQKNESPLTESQLKSYEQNGFLFLENFFSDDKLKAMQDQIETIRGEYKDTEIPEVIRESKSNDIRSIFAVHENNAFFEKIGQDPALTDIVQYLLGGEVYINQSRINYKPPFEGKSFSWHSDFETWHIEDGMPRMRALSVSITLSDNYSFNGPLMLIPGSHQYFISCLGKTPEDHYKKSLKDQEYGVPDRCSMNWLSEQFGISVPTGPAGSILLFECNTMHGSNSNITPFGRNNLFMVYNSVENKLVAPFSGDHPRPHFIASREPELVLN